MPSTISGPTAFENVMGTRTSRWSEIAERFSTDPLALEHRPKFELTTASRFFCIGSCFARNVEEALIYRGFDVLSKRLRCPRTEWQARHNGIVNKYTTASMLNEVRWALQGESGAASLIESGDGVLDLQLVPNARPVSRERALERRRYIETDYFARIAKADVIVITLGLIEIWHDNATRIWQNSAPPLYAVRREPERFNLHITGVAENLEAIETLRALVLAAQPSAKFIVTVSPVPMEATFSGTDVITANMRSKSVLRAVAEAFANAHDDVDYFPSYEIVTGSTRAAAYAPDQIHVRDSFVRKIISQFAELYFPSAPDAPTDFHEELYLAANPDVDELVRAGTLASGFEHWQDVGEQERRPLRPTQLSPSMYFNGTLDEPGMSG